MAHPSDPELAASGPKLSVASQRQYHQPQVVAAARCAPQSGSQGGKLQFQVGPSIAVLPQAIASKVA
jgi:hypothetical protein